MKVLLAQYAGACYGVERALSLTNHAAMEHDTVQTLGPLIHNPQVVSELAGRGISEVAQVAEAKAGVLVIRSHGVEPRLIEEACAAGLEVVDATCPYVKKAQKAATQLRRGGYTVVIVGEQGHPEVEAIDAYAGAESLVVAVPEDLPRSLPPGQLGVVVQTTQNAASLEAVVWALRKRGVEPLVKNTICHATTQRQESAALLARDVEAMVVVGGRNSGNTTRLFEICAAVCPNTHHIERACELELSWFAGVNTVGVTAGASTPQDQIDAVIDALKRLG